MILHRRTYQLETRRTPLIPVIRVKISVLVIQRKCHQYHIRMLGVTRFVDVYLLIENILLVLYDIALINDVYYNYRTIKVQNSLSVLGRMHIQAE